METVSLEALADKEITTGEDSLGDMDDSEAKEEMSADEGIEEKDASQRIEELLSKSFEAHENELKKGDENPDQEGQ